MLKQMITPASLMPVRQGQKCFNILLNRNKHHNRKLAASAWRATTDPCMEIIAKQTLLQSTTTYLTTTKADLDTSVF